MQWERVDEYHIKSGEWTISKCATGSDVKYALWQGSAVINVFNTSAEAKQYLIGSKVNRNRG